MNDLQFKRDYPTASAVSNWVHKSIGTQRQVALLADTLAGEPASWSVLGAYKALSYMRRDHEESAVMALAFLLEWLNGRD
jgi:hypothetical protein